MKKSSKSYQLLYDLFESPLIFNLNQWILDGGKKRPMNRFLANVPYQSVLDIGCGPGNWVSLATGTYVGIDQSPSFISAARRRYEKRPDTTFILGDVTDWEPSGRFDLILLVSVLHHLSDGDVSQLLQWTSGYGGLLCVLDLFPIPDFPVSRMLYALDRGDFIRDPEDQVALIRGSGAYTLQKEESFYSWNHLYRHTLFLFESTVPGR